MTLDRYSAAAVLSAAAVAGRVRDSGEASMPTLEFRDRFSRAHASIEIASVGRPATLISLALSQKLIEAYGADKHGIQMSCPTLNDALEFQPSVITPRPQLYAALGAIMVPASLLMPDVSTASTRPDKSPGAYPCVFCLLPIWRRYGGANRVSDAVRISEGHLGEFAYSNDKLVAYAHRRCWKIHSRDPDAILL